jgi:antitoxin component of RelBE/YafQ-DinJ toxin-antitoxin module
MTQIRPRLDDDLAAEVQSYADALHISFSAAVKVLLRQALQATRQNGKEKP